MREPWGAGQLVSRAVIWATGLVLGGVVGAYAIIRSLEGLDPLNLCAATML